MIQTGSALKRLSWEKKRKKRNDLEQVLGVGSYFLSLCAVEKLRHPLKLFSGDKIMVATCSLSICTAQYILPRYLFLITSQDMAKLRHPCTLRLFFLRQEAKTYWLVDSIYTLPSLSVFPRSIVLSHFASPSILLSAPFLFTHSFTHKKEHVLALRNTACADALKLTPSSSPAFLSLGWWNI